MADQLEAFKAEMERDGKAQQSECRKVIAAAIRKAQKLVDSTLQVSHAPIMQTHVNWLFNARYLAASGKSVLVELQNAEGPAEHACGRPMVTFPMRYVLNTGQTILKQA